MRKYKFPAAQTILIILATVVTPLTWFIPAGKFDKLFLHASSNNSIKFNPGNLLILLTFITCFIIVIVGVSRLGWWFLEMTTVFFVGAIAMGIIVRINESKFVHVFMNGANDLLFIG